MIQLRLLRSDNTISYIELTEVQNTFQVESGVVYSLFDFETGRLVSPVLLKKKDNDLVVQTKSGEVVELNN